MPSASEVTSSGGVMVTALWEWRRSENRCPMTWWMLSLRTARGNTCRGRGRAWLDEGCSHVGGVNCTHLLYGVQYEKQRLSHGLFGGKTWQRREIVTRVPF